MTTPKYFNIPFTTATPGNSVVIPDTSTPAGDVSYSDGYGLNYEGDQSGGAPALDIERVHMNELFFQSQTFDKAVFEEGLLFYSPLVDYTLGAFTRGSNNAYYRARSVNGPATSTQNPVTDATQTVWDVFGADIAEYTPSINYVAGNYVKGVDDILYECLVANGPASSVVSPVGDTTGKWTTFKTDMSSYLATFDYAVEDYTKGTDGILYRCAVVNGPTTTPVNPVGDTTGVWIILAGGPGLITTIFTSNGTFTPQTSTKTIKVTVTGGGGGGAGVTSTGSQFGVGTSGAAGGTAIKTLSAQDASYTVVVGAGGGGGDAGNSYLGQTGVNSSFDGASITIVQGNGGTGGITLSGTTVPLVLPPVLGGNASGGDLNLNGADAWHQSGSGGLSDFTSNAPGSFYGGGVRGVFVDNNGLAAPVTGGAGGGAVSTTGVHLLEGGDGSNGRVVIEEYA